MVSAFAGVGYIKPALSNNETNEDVVSELNMDIFHFGKIMT
jgi:hypothetical protein